MDLWEFDDWIPTSWSQYGGWMEDLRSWLCICKLIIKICSNEGYLFTLILLSKKKSVGTKGKPSGEKFKTVHNLTIISMLLTPSIPELIWVKNVRAIVVCGFLMKFLKKHIQKIWKKSWVPFGSYLLNSTANSAQFEWKWAWLAVLFSR